MAEQPTISALMPVRNGESYVGRAVESILRQTFDDFEFIVIDDGSTDGTRSILDNMRRLDSRLVVRFGDAHGLPYALNTGVAMAKGRYIARMDADDIAFPNRFEKQLAYMEAHPECGVVGCQVLLIDEDDAPVVVMKRPLDHEGIDRIHLSGIGGGVVHPTAFIRRSMLESVGGYDENWTNSTEDLELWLRMAEQFRFANMSDVLLAYRIHEKSFDCVQHRKQVSSAETARMLAIRRRGIREAPPKAVFEEMRDGADLTQQTIWRAMSGRNYATARKHSLRLFMRKPFSKRGLKALFRYVLLLGSRNAVPDDYCRVPISV